MTPEIAPLQTWRISFDAGHLLNETIHIRAVVDEEYIVYRSWSKRKKHWVYRVDHAYMFELHQKNGSIKLIKGVPCKR
jgi:hypothetical protein